MERLPVSNFPEPLDASRTNPELAPDILKGTLEDTYGEGAYAPVVADVAELTLITSESASKPSSDELPDAS